MDNRSNNSNFLNVVLQHAHLLYIKWPIIEYNANHLSLNKYNNLHDLLFSSNIEIQCSISTLKHHLLPPFVFGNKETHLTSVIKHYLQYFDDEQRSKPTNTRRYSIIILNNEFSPSYQQTNLNGKIYYLTFIEKVLLLIIVCFIGEVWLGCRADIISFPGSLRNLLSTCKITCKKCRSTIMPRHTDKYSVRQSIFSETLDYDDMMYRYDNKQLPPIVDASLDPFDCKKTLEYHILLYYIVMCNEILTMYGVKGYHKIGLIRFMLCNHADGGTVGLSNDLLPDYLRYKKTTLVGKILENDQHSIISHHRLFGNTSLINKYLYTDESHFVNQRHLEYPCHLVEIISDIPITTNLSTYFNMNGLMNGQCTIIPHDVQWLHGEQLIDILMHYNDLKLIDQLDRELFRSINSSDNNHTSTDGKCQYYVFCFIEHQIAAALEPYIEYLLKPTGIDLYSNTTWIVDAYNPIKDKVEALMIMPRHSVMLLNYLNIAILLRSQRTQNAHFSIQSQHYYLSIMLMTLVNPARHINIDTMVPLSKNIKSVLTFLYIIFSNEYHSG